MDLKIPAPKKFYPHEERNRPEKFDFKRRILVLKTLRAVEYEIAAIFIQK